MDLDIKSCCSTSPMPGLLHHQLFHLVTVKWSCNHRNSLTLHEFPYFASPSPTFPLPPLALPEGKHLPASGGQAGTDCPHGSGDPPTLRPWLFDQETLLCLTLQDNPISSPGTGLSCQVLSLTVPEGLSGMLVDGLEESFCHVWTSLSSLKGFSELMF